MNNPGVTLNLEEVSIYKLKLDEVEPPVPGPKYAVFADGSAPTAAGRMTTTTTPTTTTATTQKRKSTDGFSRILRLASRMLNCPMAMLSHPNLGEEWLVSGNGSSTSSSKPKGPATSSSSSSSSSLSQNNNPLLLQPGMMISHLKDEFLIVHDTTKDIRFQNHPLVIGSPYIRFFVGVPLIKSPNDETLVTKLGHLCVLDTSPRPQGLSLQDKQTLLEFSTMIVEDGIRQSQRRAQRNDDAERHVATLAHDLVAPLISVQMELSRLMNSNNNGSSCDDGNSGAGDDESNNNNNWLNQLNPQHHELLSTASNCTDVVARICQTTIDSFRMKDQNREEKKEDTTGNNNDNHHHHQSGTAASNISRNTSTLTSAVSIPFLVKSLYLVMDPLFKQVPLKITVHPSVPSTIWTEDIKIFRSAINLMATACARTRMGSVELYIHKKEEEREEEEKEQNHYDEQDDNDMEDEGEVQDEAMMDTTPLASTRNLTSSSSSLERQRRDQIIFECKDTAPNVPIEKYPDLFQPCQDTRDPSLIPNCSTPSRIKLNTITDDDVDDFDFDALMSLYSVAEQISSLGGTFGFQPRCKSLNGMVGSTSSPETSPPQSQGKELSQPAPAAVATAPVPVPTPPQQQPRKRRQHHSQGETGSIFWFSIPLIVPDATTAKTTINTTAATTTGDHNNGKVMEVVQQQQQPLFPNALASNHESAPKKHRIAG